MKKDARERKVLVTGAAGFIGAHLVHRLLAEGFEVIGVDNMNGYYNPKLKEARLRKLCMGPRFWFVPLDLVDRNCTESLFDEGEFEAVIHLAAQAGVRHSITNPDEYVASNLVGFMNVLEALRHCSCGHFIFASSSSVYGTNNKLPFTEDDCTDYPVSLYAATKKSNEMLGHAYSHLYQLPMTALRFFTVYGPWGRPDMAIFRFVEAILAGRAIDLYNFGHLRRDFTFVEDVVEGIVRLLPLPPERGAAGQAPFRVCNIGNQRSVELLYLVRVIEQCLGKTANTQLMPMQAGDVYETQASVDKLIELTGYAPRVSIEEGIHRFVDWYLGEYLPLGLGEQPAPAPLPVPLPVQSAHQFPSASAREW